MGIFSKKNKGKVDYPTLYKGKDSLAILAAEITDKVFNKDKLNQLESDELSIGATLKDAEDRVNGYRKELFNYIKTELASALPTDEKGKKEFFKKLTKNNLHHKLINDMAVEAVMLITKNPMTPIELEKRSGNTKLVPIREYNTEHGGKLKSAVNEFLNENNLVKVTKEKSKVTDKVKEVADEALKAKPSKKNQPVAFEKFEPNIPMAKILIDIVTEKTMTALGNKKDKKLKAKIEQYLDKELYSFSSLSLRQQDGSDKQGLDYIQELMLLDDHNKFIDKVANQFAKSIKNYSKEETLPTEIFKEILIKQIGPYFQEVATNNAKLAKKEAVESIESNDLASFNKALTDLVVDKFAEKGKDNKPMLTEHGDIKTKFHLTTSEGRFSVAEAIFILKTGKENAQFKVMREAIIKKLQEQYPKDFDKVMEKAVKKQKEVMENTGKISFKNSYESKSLAKTTKTLSKSNNLHPYSGRSGGH